MTKGIILNFEVDDVDKVYNSIKDKVNIVYDIKDEDFGQKHFIVEGPNEILIDVIQSIPPSEEYSQKNNKKKIISAQTKNTLINIAKKYFTEYGFAHTSLEAIVKEANMTRGAIIILKIKKICF